MGSKFPHPTKVFGTGITSMDIDQDFRKFKEECEKDDSETWQCENQRKLEKENKMCLIKFDSQLGWFTVFEKTYWQSFKCGQKHKSQKSFKIYLW